MNNKMEPTNAQSAISNTDDYDKTQETNQQLLDEKNRDQFSTSVLDTASDIRKRNWENAGDYKVINEVNSMTEENNELVVEKSWKDDLKAEGIIRLKAFANSSLQYLKDNAGEYAKYFVQRIIDRIIDYINAKLPA